MAEKTPVFRSMTRPDLMAGGERPLVMGLAFLGGFIVLGSGFSLVGVASAMVLVVGGMWGLRRMAKADPQMSKVFSRYNTYRPYYRAHRTAFAKPPEKIKTGL